MAVRPSGVAVRGLPLKSLAGYSGAVAVALFAALGGLSTAAVILALAASGALVLAIPERYRLGIIIGVAVLAGLDAFPGPDLDTTIVKAGLHAQDLVVLALCGLLIVDNVRHSFYGLLGDRRGFLIVLACLAVIFWWFVTLYRTSTQPGLVFTHSINFGRDFFTYMVMTPLFCGTLQRRSVRNAMLVVVAIGTVYIAAVYCLATVSHHLEAVLLHPTATKPDGGLTRIYSPVQDLFTAAFPLGVGAAVLGTSRGLRIFGVLVASAALAATFLSLTRATYIGSACGVGASVGVWLVRPGRISRLGLRRVVRALAGVTAIIVAFLVLLPSGKVSHTLNSVAGRLTSIGSTVSSSKSSSTVAVRFNEATLLEQRLGGHALLGLGFIDPRDQWDPSLPFGTIRNSDVGLLNVTMTMGIIGTVLYYLPLVIVTVALALYGRRRWEDDIGWLGFGALAWCIGALTSSITLVTLYSPTGVLSAAAMLGLGAATFLHPLRGERAPRSSAPAAGLSSRPQPASSRS